MIVSFDSQVSEPLTMLKVFRPRSNLTKQSYLTEHWKSPTGLCIGFEMRTGLSFPNLPEGTVTFLFTYIEDLTLLLKK